MSTIFLDSEKPKASDGDDLVEGKSCAIVRQGKQVIPDMASLNIQGRGLRVADDTVFKSKGIYHIDLYFGPDMKTAESVSVTRDVVLMSYP